MTHIDLPLDPGQPLEPSRESNPRIAMIIKTAVVLGVIVALGAGLWWRNSAWFLRSSSLEVSQSTVSAEASESGEWIYFGIEILNTTGKPLTIEDARLSNSNKERYSIHVVDPAQAQLDGIIGIGTARQEYLDNEFKGAWENRQTPRGYKLEPDHLYQLVLGLGVTDENPYNHVTYVDVTFSDGKFRGTATAPGEYEVKLVGN